MANDSVNYDVIAHGLLSVYSTQPTALIIILNHNAT
jgi:hypothetical protein